MRTDQLAALATAEAQAKPICVPTGAGNAAPMPSPITSIAVEVRWPYRPATVEADDLKALIESHGKRGALLLEVLETNFDEHAFADWCARARVEILSST